MQPKEEVEPVDEDYTKLKTPNAAGLSDYKILRRRKGNLKLFAAINVCAVKCCVLQLKPLLIDTGLYHSIHATHFPR